jgi:hypothetical protein
MIEKGKTYKVCDNKGRCWGNVCLNYPHSDSILGTNTISGYLDASPEFKEVQHLFLEHERFMTEPGEINNDENNSKEIASLVVTLIDSETGNKLNVSPVFVSDKLLFTCEFNENGI